METIRLKKLAGLLNEDFKSEGLPKLAFETQETKKTIGNYLDRFHKILTETLPDATIGEIVDGFNSIGRKIKVGEIKKEDKVKAISHVRTHMVASSYMDSRIELSVFLDTTGGRYMFVLPTQEQLGKIGKGLADLGR